MDSLRRDDVDRARRSTLQERARQTFDAMRTGIRLKRAALRARHPASSDAEIEELLLRWLGREDP